MTANLTTARRRALAYVADITSADPTFSIAAPRRDVLNALRPAATSSTRCASAASSPSRCAPSAAVVPTAGATASRRWS